MVLMGVGEWEEAALREEKKRIQSGKLKQQLPERTVEGLECSGRKEGRGEKKMTE